MKMNRSGLPPASPDGGERLIVAAVKSAPSSPITKPPFSLSRLTSVLAWIITVVGFFPCATASLCAYRASTSAAVRATPSFLASLSSEDTDAASLIGVSLHPSPRSSRR
jgi:hypothetical protein